MEHATPCSRQLIEDPALAWLRNGASRLERLTPQQLKVLTLLAVGLDRLGIEKALGCSERTVKLHMTQVVRRLGVSSRTQAALVGYHLITAGELTLPEWAMPQRTSVQVAQRQA